MTRLFDRFARVFDPKVRARTAPGTSERRGSGLELEALESRQLLSNTLVLLNTDYGKVIIQMRDSLAPLTVANVLSYVNDGSYTNTFFHRSDIQNRVLQGGGFRYDPNNGPTQITTKPPVNLETTGGSNVVKTVGLARTTEANSGTSQFYFNMADNSAGFDAGPGNLGYAVFGEVVAGWDNVLTMYHLDAVNAGGNFSTLPIKPTGNTGQLGDADLVHILSAQVVTGSELIVSAFTAGAQIVPGQNVNVTWSIKNVGTASVNSNWTDRIVLSKNAIVGDSDDINLGDFAYSAGPLAAGAEINRQAQVGIPFDPTLVPGNYNIYVVTDATNQVAEIADDNNTTPASVATLIAAPSTIAGNPVSVAASSADANILGAINSVGRAIVLTPADNTATAKWTVTDIQAASGSPAPLKEVEAWYDPIDGLAYASTPSASGLLLYKRDAQGAWTFRNLTTELSATAITSEITVFTSTDNIVHVAGLNASGQVVIYRQVRSGSNVTWEFRNLSTQDLTPQNLTTPAFVGNLISYVTTWNGLNIAGLDTDGNIQTVWWAPGLTNWSTSNLSAITGAPKLVSGLTAYLTSWGGINIAGINVNGDVTTTWWVPAFEGNWQNSNLTTLFNFPQLTGGQLSSYVAPWGGLNIAGKAADGKLSIYWWAPGLTDWNYSTNLVNTALAPAGRLSGVTSAAGTTHIIGTTDTGTIFRYRWQASQPDVWTAQDITASVLG